MSLVGTPVRIKPRPTWDVALLYPDEGRWDDSDYLSLTETTNRLVELCDGALEILPTPTTAHQFIVSFLNQALFVYLSHHRAGSVLFAPLRVRLREKTFREPDIVFMFSKHSKRMGEEYWDGADLVMEVVSGSARDRRRDLFVKRREYATVGIDEYWIVDPKEKQITVLKRRGKTYLIHAQARPGDRASSALLRGFEVDATDVFAAAVH